MQRKGCLVLSGLSLVALIIGSVAFFAWQRAYDAAPLLREVKAFSPPAPFDTIEPRLEEHDGPCISVPCPSATAEFSGPEIATPEVTARHLNQYMLASGYVKTEFGMTCRIFDPADDVALDFSCVAEYRRRNSGNRYTVGLYGKASASSLTYTVEKQAS
jgi:hypothetical protein